MNLFPTSRRLFPPCVTLASGEGVSREAKTGRSALVFYFDSAAMRFFVAAQLQIGQPVRSWYFAGQYSRPK